MDLDADLDADLDDDWLGGGVLSDEILPGVIVHETWNRDEESDECAICKNLKETQSLYVSCLKRETRRKIETWEKKFASKKSVNPLVRVSESFQASKDVNHHLCIDGVNWFPTKGTNEGSMASRRWKTNFLDHRETSQMQVRSSDKEDKGRWFKACSLNEHGDLLFGWFFDNTEPIPLPKVRSAAAPSLMDPLDVAIQSVKRLREADLPYPDLERLFAIKSEMDKEFATLIESQFKKNKK